MELNVYEIEKYQKLPDVHGAIYDAIEEFKPYNYIKLENYIIVTQRKLRKVHQFLLVC